MTSPLAPLAQRFAFNDRFLDMLVEGFDDRDWLVRGGEGNHSQWLLGHLACTRRWALREFALPGTEEQAWERHFGMGTTPTPASDDIAPALLREAYLKSGEALRTWMASLGPEQAELPFKPFPDGSKTVGGALHFLYFHETYHLGQVGLLRRIAGKKGVV